MIEFVLPSLGAEMESGTVRAWRRKPGERVERGDILVEVETEKGIIEVEVFASGVVEKLLAEPGQRVAVGTPIALLRAGPEPEPSPMRVRASPMARRRARELGVDLAALAGSGVIRVEDVERAVLPGGTAPPAPAAKPAPLAPEESVARMRRVIAAAMSASKREIPHYYVATTVDMAPALAWLERANAGRAAEARLLPAVLFVKAVALALAKFPELNARWTGDGAPPLPDVHVGVAIALRGGGVVSLAIHDTPRLALDALMAAFRELVTRARGGVFRSSEMNDGTITVSSLGDRGVEEVWPIVYPPQVGIVGVGRIVERPWVVGGQVVARPLARVTLAADHRVSDGHRGGLFLAAVEALLATPEQL